jgi:hypothetical protein
VDRFFEDAERIGITKETVDHEVRNLRGSIIGWTGENNRLLADTQRAFGICPDLTITLIVLSRRIADIFIPSRETDFRWDVLFGSIFEIDDDSFPAPSLKDNPWKAYRWDTGFAKWKRSMHRA